MEELEAVLETGGAAAAELAASSLAARGNCANCHTPLTGRFCANCGQPADVHRRSVVSLTHELVKDVVSFDSRILRTAKALVLQPGELASSFREGRTQRYVPPVRLYLFVSLLFFLALSLSNIALFQFVLKSDENKVVVEHGQTFVIDKDGDREKVSASYNDGKKHYSFNSRIVFFAREGSLHAELTPDAQKRLFEKLQEASDKSKSNKQASAIERTIFATMEKLAKDPAALNGALTAWIPRALFLLLPLFAILLAAFYWRQRKSLYFVDHMVFSITIHAFGFVLLLAAAALAQVWQAESVFWITVAVLAAYLFFAMKRFYGQNWFWTSLKFASIGFIYVIFFVLPAFGGVVVAAVMWG